VTGKTALLPLPAATARCRAAAARFVMGGAALLLLAALLAPAPLAAEQPAGVRPESAPAESVRPASAFAPVATAEQPASTTSESKPVANTPAANTPAESASPASAPGANKPAAGADRFQRGLFWSISKDGELIGHIFGTLHTNDARVTKLPKEVDAALQQAYSFCMETFPGVRYFNPHWGFRSIVSDMMLPDNGFLADLVGEEAYGRIKEHLLKAGLKEERIKHLKPWAAMHTLSGLYRDSKKPARKSEGEILDHVLYQAAAQHVVDLYQLETLEELMAAYYAFPMDAQVALLKDKVDAVGGLREAANEMVAAYLDENMPAMLDLSTAFISPGSRKLGYDKVYLKHVLFIRNVVMAHYMLAPLRRKGAFIAVGALHLYGEQGVLKLLEDYGYEVAAIQLTRS